MGLFAKFTKKIEKIFGEVQVLKFTSSYQPTSCMAKVNRLSKTNWQPKLIWLGKNVFRTPHAHSRLIVWIFIVTCRHIESNMNNKNRWVLTVIKSQMSTVFYLSCLFACSIWLFRNFTSIDSARERNESTLCHIIEGNKILKLPKYVFW